MEPYDNVLVALKKLESETNLRDFTITSETGKEWKVHKLVLHMYSDVLYRMSTSQDFLECKTGRAVLKDAEDSSIEAMIHYLYTLKVDCPNPQNIEDSPYYSIEDIQHVATHYIGVWVLGDMYNIENMKESTIRAFAQWLEGAFQWEAVDTGFDFVDHVAEAFSKLEWHPDEMWKTVVEFASDQMRMPLRDSVESAHKVIDKYPELAANVLKAIVQQNHRTLFAQKSSWGDDGDVSWQGANSL